MRILERWLARRRLSPEDREEVIVDAVARLISAAEQNRLDPQRPAGAWLRVVADHLALDRLRRHGPEPAEFDEQVHWQGQEDERIAALLDRTAAAEQVAEALAGAVRDGELEVVRIVATWLDLATFDGEAPSSRRVAERMGISHMTVQRGLKSFAARLKR